MRERVEEVQFSSGHHYRSNSRGGTLTQVISAWLSPLTALESRAKPPERSRRPNCTCMCYLKIKQLQTHKINDRVTVNKQPAAARPKGQRTAALSQRQSAAPEGGRPRSVWVTEVTQNGIATTAFRERIDVDRIAIAYGFELNT